MQIKKVERNYEREREKKIGNVKINQTRSKVEGCVATLSSSSLSSSLINIVQA